MIYKSKALTFIMQYLLKEKNIAIHIQRVMDTMLLGEIVETLKLIAKFDPQKFHIFIN